MSIESSVIVTCNRCGHTSESGEAPQGYEQMVGGNEWMQADIMPLSRAGIVGDNRLPIHLCRRCRDLFCRWVEAAREDTA